MTTSCVCTDANIGTARVEAIDSNDQAPVFVESSLFGTVEEDSEFGTSITKLEVRMTCAATSVYVASNIGIRR